MLYTYVYIVYTVKPVYLVNHVNSIKYQNVMLDQVKDHIIIKII